MKCYHTSQALALIARNKSDGNRLIEAHNRFGGKLAHFIGERYTLTFKLDHENYQRACNALVFIFGVHKAKLLVETIERLRKK